MIDLNQKPKQAMHTYSSNSKQQSSNDSAEKQNDQAEFPYTDNRPETLTQLKLQEHVNQSTQMQQTIQFQTMTEQFTVDPIQMKESTTDLTFGSQPIQLVSLKDFNSSFEGLNDFNFTDEEAETFWNETLAGLMDDADAGAVYFHLLQKNIPAVSKKNLMDILSFIINDDSITKIQCDAFVNGINLMIPKPKVKAIPEFLSIFGAQEIQSDVEDYSVLSGFLKEFLDQLHVLVRMRPDDHAGFVASQLMLEISERLGQITVMAQDGHPDSIMTISALNQCGFIERVMNILCLQDDSTRVLCHETEISRPLINTLASIKALKIRPNYDGKEIPVEEDLPKRAQKLFMKTMKGFNSKK